jgi:hypothetical protein
MAARGAAGGRARLTPVRLATFNLRGGGSARHWEALDEWIAPDLCFVQEARDPARFRLPPDAPPAGVWAPVGHGRWGSGLVARGAEVVPIPVPGFQGWVSGGALRVGGRELTAFSVHVPQAPKTFVHSANALLDALGSLGLSGPLVLAGDWNVAASRRSPGDPIRFTKGEAVLLDRLERELGLVSAWQALNPDRPLEQTLRWTRAPLLPFHCDGIFVPSAWTGALRRAEVLQGEPWRTLSDHNPVVVEIDLPG